jgi:hypothetical protein
MKDIVKLKKERRTALARKISYHIRDRTISDYGDKIDKFTVN